MLVNIRTYVLHMRVQKNNYLIFKKLMYDIDTLRKVDVPIHDSGSKN